MSFLKKVTSACADLVTARRTIWDTFDSCRTIREAVIGGRDCGKTVFLSALANHLRHHRRSEFSLGGGTLQVHWNKGAITGDKLHGLPLFDYKAARWRLSHGQWPEKTVDTSILVLRLLLEDTVNKSREQVQLEVLDLPGERVADFAMMGRSYGEWCRWRDESLTGADGTSPHYRHYLDKVKAQVLRFATAGEVVAADGSVIPVKADTLCLHGDNPAAIAAAAEIRRALESAGVAITPMEELAL